MGSTCFFRSPTLSKYNVEPVTGFYLQLWGKNLNVDVSQNSGSPKSSISNRVFHYKTIHFGVPLFWKHPCLALPALHPGEYCNPTRPRCRCVSSRWGYIRWPPRFASPPSRSFRFRSCFRRHLEKMTSLPGFCAYTCRVVYIVYRYKNQCIHVII